MTKPRPPGKPPGFFASPAEHGVWVIEQVKATLRLFQKYGVAYGDWHALALALAEQHEPDFKQRAQATLDKIISKMRERRSLYRSEQDK